MELPNNNPASNKYALIFGALIWLFSAVYYLATQLLLTLLWPTHFDIRMFVISDLGNTVCGVFTHHYVCSPLHNYMNIMFIITGITWAIGSICFLITFRKNMLHFVAFSLMVLAAISGTMTGIYPENISPELHLTGSILSFGLACISMILLGYSQDIPIKFRRYTFISGVVALLALILYGVGFYPFVGIGGIERVADYVLMLWIILFSVSCLVRAIHPLR